MKEVQAALASQLTQLDEDVKQLQYIKLYWLNKNLRSFLMNLNEFLIELDATREEFEWSLSSMWVITGKSKHLPNMRVMDDGSLRPNPRNFCPITAVTYNKGLGIYFSVEYEEASQRLSLDLDLANQIAVASDSDDLELRECLLEVLELKEKE